MAASLRLARTKADAIDDLDPTLGVFQPPRAEIFRLPDARGRGYRVGLVFAAAGPTATATPFFLDTATNTWFRGTAQALVPHRRLVIDTDSGAHDVWIGLTSITGGAPIQVFMEEVP